VQPIPRRRLVKILGYLAAWVVMSLAVAVTLFVSSERTVDVASHRATVSPDFSGRVVVHTGPVLPDVRLPSGSRLGVDVELGKTDATSLDELMTRYAAIASQPEGQIAAVRRAIGSMAVAALVQGAGLGALPLVAWAAVGKPRRREIYRRMRGREGVVAAGVVVVLTAAIVVPIDWAKPDAPPERWESLRAFVGPGVELPPEVRDVEVMSDATTQESHRLIESVVSGYKQGLEFYSRAAETAKMLGLRLPENDEKVTILVSDRHDNIGMDKVARAIADKVGAQTVFDTGDDTSTGSRWEAFSLDSVSAAFHDFEGRWAVAGNHDNGTFVRSRMESLGWTYFDDEVIDGPDGSRILGVDDPRSSGLGNWKDEKGLSFAEVGDRLSDAACAADKAGDRPNTIMVHDASMAKGALERGCVDLVIGGHIHVQSGPTAITGSNGKIGYTYTVGTTGGAAYAIAVGGKLRRPASIALITYKSGRPVGIQSILLQTNGQWEVDPWVPLTY
jgi:hypothetical protein